MSKYSSSHGFTIIEVMLFLAVTSLLAVTLLGGWSLAVNTQSYKDSLSSLTSKLQQQYTDVFNTTNDRSAAFICSKSGGEVTVQEKDADSGQSRGASDCVVMGRYLYAQGPDFTISPIVGLSPDTQADSTQTDLDVIKSYVPTRLSVNGLQDENYSVPWSIKTYAPGSKGSPLNFAAVIVRSPVSGTTSTYVKVLADNESAPSAMDVISNAIGTDLTICLDPGAPVAMGNTAVIITHNASGQTGIERKGDGASNGC